jgi:hypothetical protein
MGAVSMWGGCRPERLEDVRAHPNEFRGISNPDLSPEERCAERVTMHPAHVAMQSNGRCESIAEMIGL